MSQNIYDNTEFFNGYSQLPRSQLGLVGAPEWQSLAALLPNLHQTTIVDLGCGYGWFCRYAREQGADRVLGLDLSSKMLARATEMTQDENIIYAQQDLEQLLLAQESCDLVFSSLTLHYVVNLPHVLQQVYQALRPGGWLVFSAEHPIYTATPHPAWLQGVGSPFIWPVSQYQIEGERETDWIISGVKKQHRKLSSWLNLLHKTGFVLHCIDEWGPTKGQIEANPALAEEQERPMLFLMALQK